MTNHLDDDYLPCRLAAAEKGWAECLERERRLTWFLKGLVVQHGAGGELSLSDDSAEAGKVFGLTIEDASTPFEKATRFKLVRAGA